MVSEAGNELLGEVGDDVIDKASLVRIPVDSLISADDGYIQHVFAFRSEGGVAEGRPIDHAELLLRDRLLGATAPPAVDFGQCRRDEGVMRGERRSVIEAEINHRARVVVSVTPDATLHQPREALIADEALIEGLGVDVGDHDVAADLGAVRQSHTDGVSALDQHFGYPSSELHQHSVALAEPLQGSR